MKNFDSVPHVQCFSNVHHCVARSRHGSFASMSLLASTKAVSSSVCCNAGRPVTASVASVAVQQLQDLTPESRTPGVVWTVEGVLSDVAHCPRLQWRQCSQPLIHLRDVSVSAYMLRTTAQEHGSASGSLPHTEMCVSS